MSGHIVNTNIRHPLLEKAMAEKDLALKVKCPYCNAEPGQLCRNKQFPTHPARFKEYQLAERTGCLPKPKTWMDLPQHILKDIILFTEDNNSELTDQTSARDALDMYLEWNGIIGYTDRIIEAWEKIKEVKNG